ncbi:hypothetical protein ACH5RR_022054 [Cinchona calisaya]|uniref:Reverse transcriptase/retrotransposon-derived protein RNase H-like domain-containing protein n=1 Tax=Cinchona calisaya TaxID=153742 RepID=A0ABD2Z9X6_9GENT
MSSTPMLALPDFTRPFIVKTDASHNALGATLMQVGNECNKEGRVELSAILVVKPPWLTEVSSSYNGDEKAKELLLLGCQAFSLVGSVNRLEKCNTDDTGMFYGIQYYNDMLLQSGESGNVQTELLLQKDPEIFTFREGWAFPRKISFNGEECVMPPPADYPRLPNTGHLGASALAIPLVILLSFLVYSLTA